MTTETVAVLGTGRMGRGLAKVLAQAGHTVWLGSREAERAADVAAELGHSVRGADNRSAAAAAELVFLAYHSNDELVGQLAPALAGKLVVDISTYRDEPPAGFDPSVDVVATSAQEWTQERLPASLVLGAFQTTWAGLFDAPLLDGRRTPVFVVGDDARAKARLLALVATLPFEGVDGGPLRAARLVATAYFLVTRFARARGFAAAGHDWHTLARALNALLPAALGLPPPAAPGA